jgi:hypothetical protein
MNKQVNNMENKRIVLCQQIQSIANEYDKSGEFEIADQCTQILNKLASNEISMKRAAFNLGGLFKNIGNIGKSVLPLAAGFIPGAGALGGALGNVFQQATGGQGGNILQGFLQDKLTQQLYGGGQQQQQVQNNYGNAQAIYGLVQKFTPQILQAGTQKNRQAFDTLKNAAMAEAKKIKGITPEELNGLDSTLVMKYNNPGYY